jgi:hypothetical protein
LVVGSTAYGMIVLRLKWSLINGIKVYVPRVYETSTSQSLFVLPLYAIENVKVSKARVFSPIGFATHTEDPSSRTQVYVTQGPVETVEKAAAREGFRGMGCAHLEKLMTFFKLRFRSNEKPTKEVSMVKALVRACWPEASEEEIERALQARGKTLVDHTMAVLPDPEDLDNMDIGLDPDDLKAVKHQATIVKAARAKKSTPPSCTPATEAASVVVIDTAVLEKLPEDRGWTERPFPSADEDITLAIAKMFLPAARGCTLSKDTKRFSRWAGTYVRPSPPTHVSKSWGPTTGHSVGSALQFVIKTLWSWHEAETGEPCPHLFE